MSVLPCAAVGNPKSIPAGLLGEGEGKDSQLKPHLIAKGVFPVVFI